MAASSRGLKICFHNFDFAPGVKRWSVRHGAAVSETTVLPDAEREYIHAVTDSRLDARGIYSAGEDIDGALVGRGHGEYWVSVGIEGKLGDVGLMGKSIVSAIGTSSPYKDATTINGSIVIDGPWRRGTIIANETVAAPVPPATQSFTQWYEYPSTPTGGRVGTSIHVLQFGGGEFRMQHSPNRTWLRNAINVTGRAAGAWFRRDERNNNNFGPYVRFVLNNAATVFAVQEWI